MLVAGFRVDRTIIYITLMEERKNVPTSEKESLVDEKTILGSGIAPINEAHANAIAAYERELEDKHPKLLHN
ncbi:hypothetical protein RHGRI_021631 [Rhododendron griersonianum]|uniref:Uncharacterized protein n=1 Tax=Rhododendron griersonianum TaxID=479676 RepID=A0AAV6JP29_9ERIC|nr:hypothetical protein RHGRI_021631 [Rhododendron griersonianum]